MSNPIIIDLDVSTDNAAVDLSVESDNTEIDFALSAPIVAPISPYTGEYTVIPSQVEQVLETEGLQMTDDVTVREIPYYETSNESGITVYIGRTIND